jgi:ribosomal protein L27
VIAGNIIVRQWHEVAPGTSARRTTIYALIDGVVSSSTRQARFKVSVYPATGDASVA